MTEKRPIWWTTVSSRGYDYLMAAWRTLISEENPGEMLDYDFRMLIIQAAYDAHGEPDSIVTATAAVREAYDIWKMESLL